MKKILLAGLVLATHCTMVCAQSREFGSWEVGVIDGNEGLFAATVNDSEAVFGQFCYTKEGSCLYLIKNDTTCEEGSKTNILVNSDIGSRATVAECFPYKGTSRLVFRNFDDIDELAVGANWIGFAFPLESGKFHVTRFDLAGSDKAIEFMREAASKIAGRQGTSSDRSTRDAKL